VGEAEPSSTPRGRPTALNRAVQVRLEWLALGAALLAAVGIVALDLWSERRAISVWERERLEHQARSAEKRLGDSMEAVSVGLDALRDESREVLAHREEVARLNERMQVMAASMTGVRTFLLVNAEGIAVASNRKELIGGDWREGERYRTIRARPDEALAYVSLPFLTPLGNWTISISRAILDGRGAFDGYVAAVLDPGYFAALVDSARYAPDMVAALIHGNGKIVYRIPDPKGAVGKDLSQVPESSFNRHVQSGRNLNYWMAPVTSTGRESLMAIQTIRPATTRSDGFLVALFARETAAVFAPWWKDVRDTGALVAMAGLFGALGLHAFQRRRAATDRLQVESDAERGRQEEALRVAGMALQEEKALLGEVFRVSPAGFAILRGRDFRYEFVNPAYQALAPLRRFPGRTVAECWPDLEALVTPLLRRVVETGETFHADDMRFEIERDQPGGLEGVYFSFTYQRIPDSAVGDPRVLVTVMETTASKKAEAERSALQARVSQSERLAALGTLVAGVSHEINGPLAAVLAGAGAALEDVERFQGHLRGGTQIDLRRLAQRADELAETLTDVKSSAERIASTVKDLAVLGSPTKPRCPVHLSETVRQSMGWLPSLVTELVRVRIDIADAPKALVSETQIQQVLVNLVTNAALAIPAGRIGEVVIRLGPGTPGMVRLEVEDDGHGIAPEMLGRIFEPFFTTRPRGRGTGLGLAIIHTIVTAHGGTISVQSEVGKGSTFRVELPAAPVEPVAAPS